MPDHQEPLNGAQLQKMQTDFNAKLLSIRADVELRKRALDDAIEAAGRLSLPRDDLLGLARDIHAFLVEPAK